jgi:hypothetical protein
MAIILDRTHAKADTSVSTGERMTMFLKYLSLKPWKEKAAKINST